MQHFIINFSICLFTLWLVYKLLLENTSWHRFKRFYLLGSLISSVIIPVIVVNTVIIPVQTVQTLPNLPFEQSTQTMVNSVVVESSFSFDWNMVLLLIYGIGFSIMLYRFVKNLYRLKFKENDKIDSYKNYRLILRENVKVPHSFWNTIYVNDVDYKSGRIPSQVLNHEKAHLDQYHSIDILLIELLLVLSWFNPLIYILKYSIKLNHEFLADQAVLESGVDRSSYQQTLLAYSATSQQRSLANTFNFPIIKKRFTIMKTHTSNTAGLLRILAIIPIVAVLLIACGDEKTIIEEQPVEEIQNRKQILTQHPEVIEVVVDEGNNSYNLDSDRPSGYLEMNEESYYYEIEEGNLYVYTLEGENVDPIDIGYTITLDKNKDDATTVLRGTPLTENQKLIFITRSTPPYDADANFYSASKYGALEKQYADDLIKVSSYVKYKGHQYLVASKAGREIFINKKNEIVDLRKVAGDNLNLQEIMPPPPPPPVPSAARILKGVKDGDMKLFINNEPATPEQIERLPLQVQPGDYHMKNINNVLHIYFEGDLKNYNTQSSIQEWIDEESKYQKVGSSNNTITYQLDLTGDNDSSRNRVNNESWKEVEPYLQAPQQTKTEKKSTEPKYGLAFLRAAAESGQKITYQLDNNDVDESTIKSFLSMDHNYDITVNEQGTNSSILSFRKTDHAVNESQLQKEYIKLFPSSEIKKPVTTYTRVGNYQFYMINGDRGSGTLTHAGKTYTYQMPDDYTIIVKDENGKSLSAQDRRDLNFIVTPIWESKTEESVIKSDLVIKEHFENGEAVLFYRSGYTNDYKEMLNYDFGNTVLSKYFENGKLKIDLMPIAWKNTNPSMKDFYARDGFN